MSLPTAYVGLKANESACKKDIMSWVIMRCISIFCDKCRNVRHPKGLALRMAWDLRPRDKMIEHNTNHRKLADRMVGVLLAVWERDRESKDSNKNREDAEIFRTLTGPGISWMLDSSSWWLLSFPCSTDAPFLCKRKTSTSVNNTSLHSWRCGCAGNGKQQTDATDLLGALHA